MPRCNLLIFSLLVLLTTSAAWSLECSDPEADPETCIPADIQLPAYCQNGQTPQFTFGLNENFDIKFEVAFTSKPPSRSFILYAVDGPTNVGRPNEAKLTKLKCTKNLSDEGHHCGGTLTLEREERLAEKFDFDQSVINFVMRNNNRDKCIGKLTNNAELLTARTKVTRSVCQFTPSQESKDKGLTLSGTAFFDPRSYGLDGEGHFHASLSGFPVDRKIRGCVEVQPNRFQEAFAFRSYDESATDALIYGDLDDEERTRLTQQGLEYSYDLARLLDSESESLLGPEFSRSLSQVNLQISPPSADRERKKSNLTRKKQERKSKSRKQKKRKKSGRTNRIAVVDVLASVKKSPIFTWLAFDPLAGAQIFLSDKCNASVKQNAYGVLSCQEEQDPNRECVAVTGSQSQKASFCFDNRDNYSLLLIRAEGLPDGEYYVCLSGSAESSLLEVTNSFGELALTDNDTVVNSSPTTKKSSGALATPLSISLSTDAECSSPLLSGNL